MASLSSSSSSSSAAAALTGMYDPRLRPRLLRLLLCECLPLPDPDREPSRRRPAGDLAYALHAVRANGLLAERTADPDWRAAVDAWVERLLALLGSDREHSCWVGTSFLGLTFQECCDERFAKSYTSWFAIVLEKLKAPSNTKMTNMVTCTTMADLFVRLAKFSNLQDEATSLAQKVVNPSLRLLDENGPVADKAIDLLGLIMKLFPPSVYRHFNKVESVISGKIMSGQCNLQQSKKLATTLALLPCVRVSQSSLSLMIRRILIVVNGLLNDTFLGLEEENIGQEIMTLLILPGSKPPPPLLSQITYGDEQKISIKRIHASAVHTISALIHCCSVILTSSFPIQVTIPVRALVTLIQRVLLINIPPHKSMFHSISPLHHELIYSEVPTLRSAFLDLLGAIVNGMQRSLLPHAGSVVMLMAELFKRENLPATRRKLYSIVRVLLTCMGVGMAMHLLHLVVGNTFADLDDNSGSSLFLLSMEPIGATNWSSSKSSSRSNQAPLQSSAAVRSEPSYSRTSRAPLSVKIAALETLELLLSVGGSFSGCYWRTEVDLLLINVARDSCYKAGMYKQTPPSNEDSSIPDFQLASMKALMASFLSCPHERPPYLAQGLELFNRGKLETGTELAKFCSHALLALRALDHPRGHHLPYASKRVLPLERAAPVGLGSRSAAPEKSVLDSRRFKPPPSLYKGKSTERLGGEVSDWMLSTVDEPTDALVQDTSAEKYAIVELSRDHVVRKDANIGEHREIASYRLPTTLQNVSTSIKNDVKMAVAVKERDGPGNYTSEFDILCNPPGSFNITLPGPKSPGDASIANEEHGQSGIFSGAASRSQNVTRPTSPICAAPSASGSEWDSLDPLLDIGDFNRETAFSFSG